MRLSRVLLLAIATLLIFGRAAFCETPPDLQKTIVDGVKMLEDKQFQPFLKRYVPPKEREELKLDDPEFVKMFSTEKAPVLLAVMTYAKGQTPTMSEDGKVATYDLKGMEPPHERPLILRKYDDGLWYIDN